MYPTGIIVDVSVKLPKSVSNFLFSRFFIYRTGTCTRVGWSCVAASVCVRSSI
jgi:hypothetical protein